MIVRIPEFLKKQQALLLNRVNKELKEIEQTISGLEFMTKTRTITYTDTSCLGLCCVPNVQLDDVRIYGKHIIEMSGEELKVVLKASEFVFTQRLKEIKHIQKILTQTTMSIRTLHGIFYKDALNDLKKIDVNKIEKG